MDSNITNPLGWTSQNCATVLELLQALQQLGDTCPQPWRLGTGGMCGLFPPCGSSWAELGDRAWTQ